MYAASPDELNDPFEYGAPITVDADKIREGFIRYATTKKGLTVSDAEKEYAPHAHEHEHGQKLHDAIKQIRTASGIICFSAVSNSIRMWSYYAQSHEGICIGFKTSHAPFMAAIKVLYENPASPLDIMEALDGDPTSIAAHVSLRKASEWDFEQEYRIPIGPLGKLPRLIPFHPEAITEIRFGARVKPDFRAEIMAAISKLPMRPKLIQMGCDFDRFVLTEVELG